jgi:hypothetical protein
MFVETGHTKFHCERCEQKEKKRKIYWGQVLGIVVSDWPGEDQDDDASTSKDDTPPQAEPPPVVLPEPRRSSLGLFTEDLEHRALQENSRAASRSKRRRRSQDKKDLENPTQGLSKVDVEKDSSAQNVDELDTSSLGSDEYEWEQNSVKESRYNCERCRKHHETQEKKLLPKRPKSPTLGKFLIQAEKVMRKLLTRKDILDELSLDLGLKSWWEGKLTCNKCKKHHYADSLKGNSTPCSAQSDETGIKTSKTVPKSGGLTKHTEKDIGSKTTVPILEGLTSRKEADLDNTKTNLKTEGAY